MQGSTYPRNVSLNGQMWDTRSGNFYSTASLTTGNNRYPLQQQSPNRLQKKRRSKWFYIYWLLSLCGCIWQIYEVTSQYLSYPTVTELTISRPKKLQPPALSLCLYYPYFLDKKQFHKYPLLNNVQIIN